MRNVGAEAESIAEDVVPDVRAVGCWLERVLRSLLRHWRSCALRACKVGSKAIGYGFGRKPRTNSARVFYWTALEKNGSRATEKKTLGSCLVLKHFKLNCLLFLECLDRVGGRADKDLDSGAKPL